MIRRIILVGFLCFLSINLFAGNKAGYVLLDRMVVTFNEMSESSVTDREEKIHEAFNEMMAEAKKAKAQEQIDPVFYKRYTRILRLLKLAITEDPEGILSPLINREITAFIKDTKAENFNVEDKGNLIKFFAEAITKEISSLKEYLDSKG
ncbi:MAG: hypothetical protein ACE5WD_01410 [Candidatus Aminicenantia bacterium]